MCKAFRRTMHLVRVQYLRKHKNPSKIEKCIPLTRCALSRSQSNASESVCQITHLDGWTIDETWKYITVRNYSLNCTRFGFWLKKKTERIISTTARPLVFLSGENVQSLAQIKHFTLVACPGGWVVLCSRSCKRCGLINLWNTFTAVLIYRSSEKRPVPRQWSLVQLEF